MAAGWWWLLATALTIVSSAGTVWLFGPGYPSRLKVLIETGPTALLVFGASVFLRQVEGPWQWVSLGVAVVLLVALLLGRYFSQDPQSRFFSSARFASNLVVYILALGYFAGVYGARARSLQSVTAIIIVAFLLALYGLGPNLTRRSWLAAAVSGLMMGEVTWGLNYWPMGGLVGGIFLLLAFYGLTGTLHNYLLGQLTRSVLVEFIGVLAAGVVLIAVTSLWVG